MCVPFLCLVYSYVGNQLAVGTYLCYHPIEEYSGVLHNITLYILTHLRVVLTWIVSLPRLQTQPIDGAQRLAQKRK